MEKFKFYAPTKVYFGKDEEQRVGKILQEYHPKKVLIHYGGKSAIQSGLLNRVKKALDEENIAYCLCGGVVANPLLSKVNEGIQICKEEGVDFILAVGGGSVLDSSKGIAYGVYNEGAVWDYYARKKKVKGALPMGCILTLSATGSEMSNSSVITNEDGNLKRGLSSDYGYFKSRINIYCISISNNVWVYGYYYAYIGTIFYAIPNIGFGRSNGRKFSPYCHKKRKNSFRRSF